MSASVKGTVNRVPVLARNAVPIGLITALLMELALRAIGFSRPVLYEPDPLVGWSGRPGSEGFYLDGGGAEVRISSVGVRDRGRIAFTLRAVCRESLLGVSYTEA